MKLESEYDLITQRRLNLDRVDHFTGLSLATKHQPKISIIDKRLQNVYRIELWHGIAACTCSSEVIIYLVQIYVVLTHQISIRLM